MSIELTWLGHASWKLTTGEHAIIIDPFLTDSPTAPCSADDLTATHILVSHGHFDHISDAASIANRCGATVVSVFEIANWLSQNHDVENVVGMNIGGTTEFPFGKVKLTPAIHSSQLPDGSYGGEPAGFLVTLSDRKIYFACDTALYSDMALTGKAGIDLAVLPIGDTFTMGPEDSLEAIRFVQPARVLPAHYNTWPPIEQDANAWADRVRAETSAEPIVLEPGQSVTV